MTIAYWCLLVASLLPYSCAGLAKFAKRNENDAYDNHHPRAWLSRQTGFQARANAAQLNGFEALPFFVAAVFLAHHLQVLQIRIDALAMGFVLFRMAFIALYVLNWATLRTVVWTAAFGCNLALFLSAALN
jgi:uncharacterized MAPEG superfamily protein